MRLDLFTLVTDGWNDLITKLDSLNIPLHLLCTVICINKRWNINRSCLKYISGGCCLED